MMKQVSRSVKRLVACLMALMLFVGTVPAAQAVDERVSYYNYLQNHAYKARPEETVSVDLTQYKLEVAGSAASYQDKEGSAAGIEITEECRQITFTVDIPATGLYNIEMTYRPTDTIDRKIMFGLLIDGKVPFTEAYSCIVNRTYKNDPIVQDQYGNDVRPRAQQQYVWRTQFLHDQTGINGNLAFYLEEGKREITFDFDSTAMLVERIAIKQEPYTLSYQDYLSLHLQSGHQNTIGVQNIYQGENYYLQSSSTLWPDTDYSSPLTQPFDYKLTRINIGGGAQWKVPGDWISWKIEVPEDGFYNIGVKFRQNYLDGLFSSRMLYIDGVVPFEELKSVRFNYSTDWTNLVLGNGTEAYSIYLTKGEHILTMENVMGDMEETMNALQNVVNELNSLYLSIIMITGSEPDKYRDYYLNKLMPDLPADLRSCARQLFDEAERMIEVVGSKGVETAYFEDIAYNLENYAANIGDLTFKSRLTNLKNDISSLSAKLQAYQEQALDIDYITISSADMDMPRVKLNAFEWVTYQANSFAATYRKSAEEEDADITVWMGGGNKQYEIVQSMINDLFTPQTGITVDLVLGGTGVINAVLSGVGPDVMMNGGDIVDLALRGGLERLDTYPGYDELMAEYVPGINIPNTLEGGVYAIQTTGGFSMMFVRTDIFERLKLQVPKTWDDVLDISQVLQRNNMTLGIVPPFATLLYQMGGEYYSEDLKEVAFSEEVAVQAFITNTEYYTKYGFPVAYNFLTQFRTGEMPIALAAYSTYNQLKFSAPEISGLWEMYEIPGVLQEDGTINNVQASGGSGGVVIPSTSKNKDAAWAFIKWWCGAEAQERYGKDQEAALGISARYATMNLEVFQNIGWTKAELEVLNKAMNNLRFTPVVPGDYYINRGITNTFHGVVNQGANVRELLDEWTVKINEEMERKREEFHMNN